MGQINNKLLLEKGLRTEFSKALNNGETPQEIMPLMMQASSTSDKEKYGWLGEVAQMSEWLDERKLRGLADFDYEIPNRDYESTLKVPRNALEDDQLGAINLRIRDLVARGMTHPRKLFFDLLINGEADLGYDGVPFFSASHVESGSAQSNLQSATLAGAQWTVQEMKDEFCKARATMRAYKDDQGEPRNEGELDLYLVGGQDSECVMDELFQASMLNNTTNTLKGAAKKMISSRLEGNDVYLMDASGTLKPTVMQTRSPLKFESLTQGDDAFMRKNYYYGVDYRVGVGYGVWYKAIKIKTS